MSMHVHWEDRTLKIPAAHTSCDNVVKFKIIRIRKTWEITYPGHSLVSLYHTYYVRNSL